MKVRWDQFGGQLGVGLCVAGFLLIFLGWNGAASQDRVPSQFPYLISGGVAGLSLIIIGVAVMVIQAQRADRAMLLHSLAEVRELLERTGGSAHAQTMLAPGLVLAGPTTFHRTDCPLIEGRGQLPAVDPDEALAQGLSACRTCDPLAADVLLDDDTDAGNRRTRRG